MKCPLRAHNDMSLESAACHERYMSEPVESAACHERYMAHVHGACTSRRGGGGGGGGGGVYLYSSETVEGPRAPGVKLTARHSSLSEGCSLISVKRHSGISTRPLPSALGLKHWLCHAGLVPKELVDTQRPAVSSGYPVSGKWLPSVWPESAGSKGPLPTERKPQ